MLDTLIVKAKHVSYTVLLIIGNTFRNVPRLTMTQVVLVGSGMLFIAVMGVNDAVRHTFGTALRDIHRYEITYTLQKDARSTRLVQFVAAQPNVRAVESWNSLNGSVRPQTQPKHDPNDERAMIFGMPLDTAMYAPSLRSGRWLQSGDDRAVTVHEELARKLGIETGDWITLRVGSGDESDWEVVGTFFDPARDSGIYMDQHAFAAVMTRPGKTNTLFIQTEDATQAAVAATNLALKQFLEGNNLPVVVGGLFDVTTIDEITARRLQGFSMLISLLSIMVVVVAIVGSIGLSGTLSLSVMERTREIGVMRAIGASSRRITGLFVGEGLIQAIMSWAVAIPLGIVGAYLLSTVVLTAILGDELIYIFRPTGILIWLIVVVVLGIAASWLPARRATRVSVRESLAYQ